MEDHEQPTQKKAPNKTIRIVLLLVAAVFFGFALAQVFTSSEKRSADGEPVIDTSGTREETWTREDEQRAFKEKAFEIIDNAHPRMRERADETFDEQLDTLKRDLLSYESRARIVAEKGRQQGDVHLITDEQLTKMVEEFAGSVRTTVESDCKHLGEQLNQFSENLMSEEWSDEGSFKTALTKAQNDLRNIEGTRRSRQVPPAADAFINGALLSAGFIPGVGLVALAIDAAYNTLHISFKKLVEARARDFRTGSVRMNYREQIIELTETLNEDLSEDISAIIQACQDSLKEFVSES